MAIIFLAGCRSSSPATTSSRPPSLPAGETEVITPCSGSEYLTDNEIFRAGSVGESLDQSIAKRKALSNARTELAAAIQTTIQSVTENYVHVDESDNEETIEEQYTSFSREVVNQELRGLRIICERYTRTAQGKYKAYVTLELSAQHLVDAYYERLAQNKQLVLSPDYETFQQTFQKEMTKSGH